MKIPDSLRPWLLPVGAVLVLLALAGIWNRDHKALLAARAAAEAAQLQLKGQIVSAQESAGALKADVAKLLAENDELRAAYDAARAAAPGAQPVHAATLSTGIVEVAASQRPSAVSASPVPAAEDKGSSSAVEDRVLGGQPPSPACVLAEGDKASIDVDEVTLLTKGGNWIVVGTAAAWRESPSRSKLFGGKFQSSVSDVSGLAPPAPPRWGAGAGAVCFLSGCAAGPVLALPPARFWGLQAEGTIGVVAGAVGLGALATGVLRW